MRRRVVLWSTCALTVVVALAACGGGASTPAGSPSAPDPVGSGPGTSLTVVAKDIAFSPAAISAPAGSPLHVRFDNQDVGVPHDLALFGDAGFSTKIVASEIKAGPSVQELSIPGLVPGTYQFRCDVHPNMTAQLTIGG